MSGRKHSRAKRKYKDYNDDPEPMLKPDFHYDGFDQASPSRDKKRGNAQPPKQDTQAQREPSRPGKDRQRPQVASQAVLEIKQVTKYQMLLSPTTKAALDAYVESQEYKLEFEPAVFEFLEEMYCERSDWDRFEKDLKKLSTKFSGQCLAVRCHGEDIEDIWVAFARDGRYYYQDVPVVYPEFDYTRLK